jgi:hypothetical protein
MNLSVGDRVRVKPVDEVHLGAFGESEAGRTGIITGFSDHPWPVEVQFDDSRADDETSPETAPYDEDMLEVLESATIPESHILPLGELYVVSRHSVPAQVEYFGTDKNDCALYREVK